MFKKSRLLALFASVVMGLALTSCADTNYAMEINSQQIPAGQYILYQNLAISESQNHEDYDITLEDYWDNNLDGMPVEDWVNEKAVYIAKQVYATNELFDELGLSLSEDDLAAIEYDMETWDEVQDGFEDLGVGESSYEAQITDTYKSSLVFAQYYAEDDGVEPIKDEDLVTYFEDDFTLYKSISFSKLDAYTGTMMTEEAIESVRDRADDYYKKVLENPEDIDAILEEKILEDSIILDTETPVFEDEAVYMQIAKKGEGDIFESYYVSQDIEDAIFADAKIGEPSVIEDENSIYVVLRLDINDHPEYFDILRETLLDDLKNDEFTLVLEEKAADLDVVLNDAAINRYSPKKLLG